MKAVQYIFLRLYGLNLGRSFRNTPKQACSDAITQLMIVIGMPCFFAILAVLSWLYPGTAKNPSSWLPWAALGAGALGYVITKPFERYAAIPEAAESYTASRSRIATMVGFVLVPLICIGLLFVALKIGGRS